MVLHHSHAAENDVTYLYAGWNKWTGKSNKAKIRSKPNRKHGAEWIGESGQGDLSCDH